MKRSASGEAAAAAAKKQKTTPLAAYQQAQEHLRNQTTRHVCLCLCICTCMCICILLQLLLHPLSPEHDMTLRCIVSSSSVRDTVPPKNCPEQPHPALTHTPSRPACTLASDLIVSSASAKGCEHISFGFAMVCNRTQACMLTRCPQGSRAAQRNLRSA